MPGKAPRDKGNRFEREVVNAHKRAGLDAERIPLSGAAGGSFGGDVKVYIPEPWRHDENKGKNNKCVDCGEILHTIFAEVAECKARANGFKQIYKWLEGNDLLFLKADRKEPLVVVPMSLWLKILGGEKRRGRHLG